MALASIVLLRDSLIEFVVSHLFCYCSIACQTTRFLGHKSFMVCTGFFSFTACMSCKNEKKNEFYVSLHPPIDYKTTHSTTNSRSSIEISILRYILYYMRCALYQYYIVIAIAYNTIRLCDTFEKCQRSVAKLICFQFSSVQFTSMECLPQ